MDSSLLLLMPTNPMVWIMIGAVIVLLFGANRIPKLARALGETKRGLKDGLQGSTPRGTRNNLDRK
jgi:TatA/E family protein of Tat protein translocase